MDTEEPTTHTQQTDKKRPSPIDNQQTPDDDQDRPKRYLGIRNYLWKKLGRRVRPERIAAFFAMGIFFVTSFYTCYARQQVIETRKATNAAVDAVRIATQANTQSAQAFRIDQRAWLALSGYRIETQDSTGWVAREPIPGENYRIRIGLRNPGKTPALNISVQASRSFSPVEPREPNWDEAERRSVATAVFSTDIDQSMIVRGTLPDDAEGRAYVAENANMNFWVRASYCDVSKRQHWTQVCFSHTHGSSLDTVSFCRGAFETVDLEDDERDENCG